MAVVKYEDVEDAISAACDEGTFEYGVNAETVIAEMATNVLKLLQAARAETEAE